MEQRQVPAKGWAVVAGLSVALILTVAGGVVGLSLGIAKGHPPLELQNPATVWSVFATPPLLLAALWWLLRRRMPNFATGILSGGSVSLLLLGYCGVFTLAG